MLFSVLSDACRRQHRKMFSFVLCATSVALFCYLIYKWLTAYHKYFEMYGLRHMKPSIPFGNTFGFYFGQYTGPEFMSKIYNQFPGEKIFGMFDSRKPLFVVRDPGLLKQLTVRHFDHFPDHKPFVDEKVDALFGNSLFMLTGEKWRDMRTTLSPAFTGSKMRQMFELVTECAENMTEFFLEQSTPERRVSREMKDVFSRYTNDVIASCAFGIQINSLRNQTNEFFVAGQRVREFAGALAAMKMVLMKIVPVVTRALDITMLDRKVTSFFRSMIIDTMAVRKQNGIYRPDMINILMQVRQGELRESKEDAQSDGLNAHVELDVSKSAAKRTWSDDEIAAQAFLFFVAGFETTSTMLTFAAYELALNPLVQNKLYEEIAETNAECYGERIGYDRLQKMRYMDQVVNESLRKWPPAVVTDRVCMQDFEYSDENNLRFRIEKNMSVWVPIYGFHHDPNYFADPERFDPERFNEENKKNIIPGTYIPFGYGPRNCIGSRFALMEIKAVLYYLLLNFTIEPNRDTPIPVKLKKTPMGLVAEDGLSLDFVARKLK